MRKMRTILAVLVVITLVTGICFTGVACSQPTLDSIAVTTAPTKVSYIEGQTFDKAGMVITAKYSDGKTEAVTDYTFSPSGALATTNTKITITYKEKTVEQTISVAAKAVSALAITTAPTKTLYKEGETFDSTGMVVKATYNDGTINENVTGYVVTPSGALATTHNKVVVSFGEKTVDQAIAVSKAIATVEDYNTIYDNLGGYYHLTADIDFEGATIAPFNDGGDYDNGDDVAAKRFTGIFDGKGYALKNLTVQKSAGMGNTGDNQQWGHSIFGQIGSTGIVKNFSVINLTATGTGQNAAIAQTNFGTVENIYFEDIKLSSLNDWGPWCSNAIIVTFNKPNAIVRNCVVASATTTAGTNGKEVYPFLLNAEGATNEEWAGVYNLFAVTDGFQIKDLMQTTADSNGKTYPGSALFSSEDIAEQDFSALGDAWILTEGKLPALAISISTVAEFESINNKLDGNYYLTQDIDFEGAIIATIGTWDSDNHSMQFTGLFDGKGFSLKNMEMFQEEFNDWGVALFAEIGATGIVRNVNIINMNLKGFGAMGLIAGLNDGLIENCYAEGSFLSTNSSWWEWPWAVGGSVAARLSATGVIRNVVTNITTPSTGSLNSVVGCTWGGIIENCFVVADNISISDPIGELHIAGGTQGTVAPTKTNVVAFWLDEIGDVDFSALDSNYWTLTAGELPVLGG